MTRDDDDVKVAVTVLALVAAAVLLIVSILSLGGCAIIKKPLGTLEARVDRVEASVSAIAGDVSGIKTGDIKIGGGTNDIVSWIMAGGYIVVILGGIAGALIYPVLVRPIRLKLAAGKGHPPSQ